MTEAPFGQEQPRLSQPTWWHRGKLYSRPELIGDAVVHAVGLLIAFVLGGSLVVLSSWQAARSEWLLICLYVFSLVLVLGISLAFNMAPLTASKRLLARMDQAGIFVLIAGTYTPLLAMLEDTATGRLMMIAVWSAALVGVALKLFVPQRFKRLGLVLYLGIGASGVAILPALVATFPPGTLLLIVAGGVAYCSGVLFHLWKSLNFHNVIWHSFVVLGATIHLWAVLNLTLLQQVQGTVT